MTERILTPDDVDRLGRRLPGVEPDLRAVVLGRRVVELEIAAFGDVRIVEAREAEAGLAPGAVLLLHDGPAQPPRVDVFLVRGEVLVLEA